MHRFFIDEKIVIGKITPSKELLHQLKNVLKFSNNKQFKIFNSEGEYISTFDGKNIIVIKNLLEQHETDKTKVILVQSLIKNSKLSFLVQKVTEIGIDEIVFVETKRSIPKISDYQQKKNRIEKIISEAIEQSNQLKIPNLTFLNNLSNLMITKDDLTILAYENQTIKKNIYNIKNKLKKFKNIYLVIGPEGGFSSSEIDTLKKSIINLEIVSISKNILRAETAAILLTTIVNYELNN